MTTTTSCIYRQYASLPPLFEPLSRSLAAARLSMHARSTRDTSCRFNLGLGLGEERQPAGELGLGTDEVGEVGDGQRVLEAVLDALVRAGRPAADALEQEAADLDVAGVAGVDLVDVGERLVEQVGQGLERVGQRGQGRERGRRRGVGREEVIWVGSAQ